MLNNETLHTTAAKIKISTDTRIIQAGRLLAATQAASAARKSGRYSFEHVSSDVKLIIWTEDPIAQDETVAIVEFEAQRTTFIRDAHVAHSELRERLGELDGWEVCEVDGLIARAAESWAYAQ